MSKLSSKQFSHTYPFPNEQSEDAWSHLLQRYRDDGKLIEMRDWKHAKVDGSLARTYEVARVVFLICKEARGDRPRPRVSYLFQEYYDEFCRILTEAAAAKEASSGKAQDKPFQF